MIFFYCSECREELEGEDSIRGARMKCPACFSEIEVPQASVKVADKTARREGPAPASASESMPGSKFILIVLLGGLVGLLIISGIGGMLRLKAQERARKAQPICGTCEGKGHVPCAVCSASKKQPCKECSGSGKRKNFRDEEEVCFRCNGRGSLDCIICDGRGIYGCVGCNGSGRLVPHDPAPKR